MSWNVLKEFWHSIHLDDIKQCFVTQRLGSRSIPLFLQRYLLVLRAERAFEGGQEGIGHALLSFVRDREPVCRIQNPCRPLDQGLLAIDVEEEAIMEVTRAKHDSTLAFFFTRRCPDAARRSPIDDVVLPSKPMASNAL